MGSTTSIAARYDTLYKKDAQGFRVDKGAVKELRYYIPYGSAVTIRVASTYPVIFNMTGPHIEQAEIVGTKEYRFTAEPGSEIYIRFQGKSGFFDKPSNVTLEVEMYTSREALQISESITNLLETLKELGRDYYLLNKEHIQSVMKSVANVWRVLDNDTKSKARELMNLAKQFETGTES